MMQQGTPRSRIDSPVLGKNCVALFGLVFVLLGPMCAKAGDDLAKESQNPLSTVVSLPFENNTMFGIGPSDAVGNVLNIKPVYPVSLGDWNLINRLIVPVVWSEGQDAPVQGELDVGFGNPGGFAIGSAFGLADTTYQAFFSPAKSGKITWGAGPVLVIPTHTKDQFGTDKWSVGPTFVALVLPGKWVLGVLAQNVWSFAGDSNAPDVNKFVFQYFVNYNLDKGWYLSTGPVITANWESDSSNRWTVPVGGGVGRLVKFGKQPVDLKLAAYYNVEKPQHNPDWSLQLQVKFLFPK